MPGRKQVWRRYGPDGSMAGDMLSAADDAQPGEPLIHQVMGAGKRLAPTLNESRAHAAREFQRLPEPLRELKPSATYSIEVGEALINLAVHFDQHLTDQN